MMNDELNSGKRARRIKNSPRFQALEKLKNVRKGIEKHTVKDEEDVYEEVDEEKYSELVQKRQLENWIVDDDGEYVEDGRELFDDYENDVEEDTYSNKSSKLKQKKKTSLDNSIKSLEKGSIKSFFIKQQIKEKNTFKDINLDEDAILEDILTDNNYNDNMPTTSKPQNLSSKPFILPKKRSFQTKKFSNTPKRTFKRSLDDKEADFESYLDPEFMKDLNSNSKKIKEEPIEDIYEQSQQSSQDHWYVGLSEEVKTEIEDIGDSEIQFIERNGEKFLKMFWIDAFEDPKTNGRVYLFGKIQIQGSFVSCCIIVENIERRIFILPKKESNTDEVHKEFSESICKKYKIKTFRTRKIKKLYAFDNPDVPCEAEYLEVLYPPTCASLPSDLRGDTFHAVFGIEQPFIERFLLDLKIKGPCWLLLKNTKKVDTITSWCKKELTMNFSVKNIILDQDDNIPPLTLCCLNLKVFAGQIVAIACLVKKNFRFDQELSKNYDLADSFCMVTKPHGFTIPYDYAKYYHQLSQGKNLNMGKAFDNEHYMLNQFLLNIYRLDPDIIVGYDFSFELDSIINRQAHYNDKINWSRLGRLRRSEFKVQRSQKEKFSVTCGRCVCDVKIMAKQLIRAKTYELDELVVQVLKKERKEEYVTEESFKNSISLIKYLNHLLGDNVFILSLMFELNILPLALEITKICGNLFSRTLLGGRSELNEYLLLHAFDDKNYILPEKVYKKLDQDRRKAAYLGGLVLEPKVGFYETFILLMDFNSLYPSIIQEYNICFTTVKDKTSEIPSLPSPELASGILPTEISKLVKSRREVKRLLMGNISSEQKAKYNIKQLALKLTANSMYGCLGYTNSRFYAKSLAALITSKGREILMNTKSMIEKIGLEVIYGDTDSIMINTNSQNYNDVIKLGIKIQSEINALYNLLEIEIDGVYKSMLLLRKKKYAALMTKMEDGKLIFSKEVKGLDIVRRDWSNLARNTGEIILEKILSGNKHEIIIHSIHEYLKSLVETLRSGQYNEDVLHSFVITKQLSKNPEDYQEKSLVHVIVASRRNSVLDKKFKSGDVVPYIICTNPDISLPETQRAYHPDEMKADPSLKIDIDYYLNKQIFPVVSRLCEPLDGIDNCTIAEFLGIEGNFSAKKIDIIKIETDNQYDRCRSGVGICDKCGTKKEFRSSLEGNKFSLECVCGGKMSHIYFLLWLRKIVNEYYESWNICEDPVCAYRTKSATGYVTRNGILCKECKEYYIYPEITDEDLYREFTFLENILDLEKAVANLTIKEKNELLPKLESFKEIYSLFRKSVTKLKTSMSYNEINLDYIFKNQYFDFSKIKI